MTPKSPPTCRRQSTPSPPTPFSAVTVLLLLLGLWCPSSVFAADRSDHETLWSALRDGTAIALLRHAIAPGTGDPAGFTIDDCSTQRNLSNQGKAQARAIGDAFRANDITQARIFSSQWCRCLETARLLNLGEVSTLVPLNSFFRNFERRDPQLEALREWLRRQPTGDPLILVTHQVNITALTDFFPRSGELVVVDATDQDRFKVLGTITVEP